MKGGWESAGGFVGPTKAKVFFTGLTDPRNDDWFFFDFSNLFRGFHVHISLGKEGLFEFWETAVPEAIPKKACECKT